MAHPAVAHTGHMGGGPVGDVVARVGFAVPALGAPVVLVEGAATRGAGAVVDRLRRLWRLGGGRDSNAYLSVAPYIGKALRENSGLRVFVGQGWYDFATPFFAAEYALTRTGIPQDRIDYRYYDSGHMMYVRAEDRAMLSADVRAFIRGR